MFNNRFNSSKNDPLVEAVKAARADGDTRRLAESMTNGLFGVFSRQAVVREHLSDYDFALEEAYKCISMKEEDKMADKDYDRDGKVETPKKEVWGSRLRAAKASGKYKGPVDEDSSNGLPPSDARKSQSAGSYPDYFSSKTRSGHALQLDDTKGAAQQSQTPSSTPKRTGNAAGSTISNARDAAGMNEEEQIDEISTKLARSFVSKAKGADRTQGVLRARGKMTGEPYPLVDKKHGNVTVGHASPKVLTKEEQIDELKKPTAKTAMKAYHRAYDSDVRSGEGERSNRLSAWKQKHLPGKSARNQKDTGKADLPDVGNIEFHKAGYSGHVTKGGKLTKAASRDTKDGIKSRLGKHTKPKHLPEEALDEISKELAGRYIKKADYKRSDSSFQSGKVYGNELATKRRTKQDVEDARKHNRDSFKREKGINTAVNKLTGRAKVAANEELMKESIKAKLFAKHMKEDQSFKAAQETGKSVNEVAMGVPPAITPPVISRPAKSTSGMKAPTGSFRGVGAQPLRTSSTQVNFNSVKPSAGYNLASRMSAAGRDAAGSRASNLSGMNAVDRIGGAIKSASSSSSAKAMVDGGRAAVSRGVGALGAGARIARGAVGGPTGAALTAATIAAPYVASKMAASHKAGSTATPGVSTHQQTPDVKASDSFSRMRGMSQTSTASSTPAATAASKPAMTPIGGTAKPSSVKQSFSQAYRAAREAGGSKAQFTWQGKQYQAAAKKSEYIPSSQQVKVDTQTKPAVAQPQPKAQTPGPVTPSSSNSAENVKRQFGSSQDLARDIASKAKPPTEPPTQVPGSSPTVQADKYEKTASAPEPKQYPQTRIGGNMAIQDLANKAAESPATNINKDSSVDDIVKALSPKKQNVQESVQVGVNKYRIV